MCAIGGAIAKAGSDFFAPVGLFAICTFASFLFFMNNYREARDKDRLAEARAKQDAIRILWFTAAGVLIIAVMFMIQMRLLNIWSPSALACVGFFVYVGISRWIRYWSEAAVKQRLKNQAGIRSSAG